MPLISEAWKDKKKIKNYETMSQPNEYKGFSNYKWADDCWKEGNSNHWLPTEIPMEKDKNQWNQKGFLSEEEKKLILFNLGFFSTAETLTGNNLIVIFPHLVNFECRKYLCRQIFEEAVHSETFVYCCESLRFGVNKQKEIFRMHEENKVIKEKDDFVRKLTSVISDPTFQVKNDKDIRKFLLDLIGYYVIMEGIFFYAGFAMMLALAKEGKMLGIGKQFYLIMRDESVHLKFGCHLINTIKEENPEVWTKKFEDQGKIITLKEKVVSLIEEAVALEEKYALEACPQRGIYGIKVDQFIEYVKYIAGRRLQRIGLEEESKKYPRENPFTWMSTVFDLNKKTNFFEGRVVEYRSSSDLKWDDEEE